MDKSTLLRGLAVTAELLGTPLSPDALEIMANDLMELGTGAGILQALDTRPPRAQRPPHTGGHDRALAESAARS